MKYQGRIIMKVRKAEIKDAATISKINVETWQDAYKGLIDDSILSARRIDDKRISIWEKIIQNPDFIVLVCEEQDIVGYLSAGSARDEYGINNEIYAFYVHPSAQGNGYGSALIKEYRKLIQNQDFYLYALKDNQKAGDFYTKNGGVIYEQFNRDITIKNQTLEEVCYIFR